MKESTYPKIILWIFLLSLPFSLAVTYMDGGDIDPRDCVDVELFTNEGYLEDNSKCPSTIDECIDPKFSVCAVCIHPGAEENCYDGVDNDCNTNEGTWDNDTKTGVDFEDPFCKGAELCYLDEVYWGDECVIDGDETDLLIDAPYCEGQTVSFTIIEDDPIVDNILTGPEFTIPDLTISGFPDFQTWKVTYDIGNDDGKDKNGIPKDLQYKFKTEMDIAGHTIDKTSKTTRVRYCDDLIDGDCDHICDPGEISIDDPKACVGQDNCPNTPPCDEVDDNGCSDGQNSCLVWWDCSSIVWGECDEETYTRIIISGECVPKTDFPVECEGSEAFLPIEKSCLENIDFPFFTNLNVFLVILILIMYYTFRRK